MLEESLDKQLFMTKPRMVAEGKLGSVTGLIESRVKCVADLGDKEAGGTRTRNNSSNLL